MKTNRHYWELVAANSEELKELLVRGFCNQLKYIGEDNGVSYVEKTTKGNANFYALINEWQMLELLQESGITPRLHPDWVGTAPTPAEGKNIAASIRMELIGSGLSLSDYTRAYLDGLIPLGILAQVLAATRTAVDTLYNLSVKHNDLHCNNILISLSSDDQWVATIIDLEFAHKNSDVLARPDHVAILSKGPKFGHLSDLKRLRLSMVKIEEEGNPLEGLFDAYLGEGGVIIPQFNEDLYQEESISFEDMDSAKLDYYDIGFMADIADRLADFGALETLDPGAEEIEARSKTTEPKVERKEVWDSCLNCVIFHKPGVRNWTICGRGCETEAIASETAKHHNRLQEEYLASLAAKAKAKAEADAKAKAEADAKAKAIADAKAEAKAKAKAESLYDPRTVNVSTAILRPGQIGKKVLPPVKPEPRVITPSSVKRNTKRPTCALTTPKDLVVKVNTPTPAIEQVIEVVLAPPPIKAPLAKAPVKAPVKATNTPIKRGTNKALERPSKPRP